MINLDILQRKQRVVDMFLKYLFSFCIHEVWSLLLGIIGISLKGLNMITTFEKNDLRHKRRIHSILALQQKKTP